MALMAVLIPAPRLWKFSASLSWKLWYVVTSQALSSWPPSWPSRPSWPPWSLSPWSPSWSPLPAASLMLAIS